MAALPLILHVSHRIANHATRQLQLNNHTAADKGGGLVGGQHVNMMVDGGKLHPAAPPITPF